MKNVIGKVNRRILFLCFILIVLPLGCKDKNKVTIYRDNWGVPHIYAPSESALAFAFGYTQAEDRLVQILSSYRYAVGTMAEAFGEKYVNSDYNQRVWQHAKIAKEKFPQISTELQETAKHFVAGIQHYMQTHKDKVPDWAPEIQPWHVLALGRSFIWGWPQGQARSDMRRGKMAIERPHHSNQWLVSPQRTAGKVPIALIDPHLNFHTSGKWLEAALHSESIDLRGMVVPGTPFIALGHNQYISWAATTGGPDCADVYELEINPDNPMQYKYDNGWREIKTEMTIIRVKTKDGHQEIKRSIERSHYGPIQERIGNKAYAFKIAYAEEVLLVEQMYKTNRATNLNDFKAAISMCQMMPQNMMCATIEGDIYYARTGMVPIRPDGYDWDYPVPGNTKATEWQGIHPHEDLLQITNPKQGFMQNCNISPGTMMPDSPFTTDKYPSYIYNDEEDRSNPRGRSAVRLLDKADKMTEEQAKQIALNTMADGFQVWQSTLKQAFDKNLKSFKDLKEAVELITNWNGYLNAEEKGPVLYRAWRRECQKLSPIISEGENIALSEKDQRDLLHALKKAKAYLLDKFGTYHVAWGDAVRLKRGDKSWPVNGGSFENGVNVLRAAGGRFSKETGITAVDRGQSCTMIVILGDPIRSFSILPFGQSDDPKSNHFTDQAEALWSKSTFKSTYFDKDELLQNLESTTELLIPEILQ